MPDDSKENKAKKLAAARKKLKEYQTKDKRVDINGQATEQDNYPSGTTSATLSEKSNSELNLNGQGSECDLEAPPLEQHSEATNTVVSTPNEVLDAFETTPTTASKALNATMSTAAAYFNTVQSDVIADSFNKSIDDGSFAITALPSHVQQNNAIQLLISEKAQLNAELSKYRTSCREKDLENEELRTQLISTKHRLDDLQQRYLEQQQAANVLQSSAAELQKHLNQAEAKNVDQMAHLNELQQQLSLAQARSQELEQQHKDKCNELELSQIRINQLSDVATITKDTRVETLTQTQFMYEQQIRDLQAMVQQLTQDKEQANLQYQNYAQHLNVEVGNLNEKNSELSEECAKLQEHEQQLVRHISELEREIQRNIARRDQIKENNSTQQNSSTTNAEMETEIKMLKEKISDLDFERHEFQLKIKSQEDRLETYVKVLEQKQLIIDEMTEHVQNINSEQPDKTKLLATMESDKIAASRALTQNIEMKKQLDELEQRFVQLTNDKADLMNKLDAEEYANREMRITYAQMEEKLHAIDERFKFKDEEMIRLSHENMELTRKNLILQQQVDQLKHYEVKEYSERYAKDNENDETDNNFESKPLIAEQHDHGDHECNHDHDHGGHGDHGTHEHNHNHDHAHNKHHKHQNDHHNEQDQIDHSVHAHDDEHSHNHEHAHNHEHDHSSCSTQNSHSDSETASCQEAKEDQHFDRHEHENAFTKQQQPQTIPSTQAVKKLQQRFTKLMAQVADLTDEKQRLEHLVLQLQGETETIGEYIALYQTQRRILKQREYEKAAQMQLLQAERAQMQEKITMLNNLVSSLGVELPSNRGIIEHLNHALTEQASSNNGIDPALEQQQETHQAEMAINQKLNSAESKQILSKIQNIITEIKENTKEIPTVTHTVDHFNCCLGKFEVV